MFNSIWFDNLIQPPFAPPSVIFAPVWTALYILIFLALIIYIFKSREEKNSFFTEDKLNGYIAFTVQMLLNLAWSPVFFGLKNISAAFAVIIFLDLFAILTAKKFRSVSKFAGILFVPYILWLLFATYLNLGYLILNPTF